MMMNAKEAEAICHVSAGFLRALDPGATIDVRLFDRAEDGTIAHTVDIERSDGRLAMQVFPFDCSTEMEARKDQCLAELDRE